MANRKPEESLTTPRETIEGIPDYGWRVKLDYECTEKCKPFQTPRLSQIPSLVGLGLRYTQHTLKCFFQGRRPHMDFTNPVLHKPIYGCPMGGIGTGTIGRGYRGEFCRFQMVPGMYEYNIVQANAFMVCIRKNGETVYQKVLTGRRVNKTLRAWQWGFPSNQATYHTLYPRAWTEYLIPEHNVHLVCRQVSPIIPHDYKDSSFPMTAFIWSVENQGAEELDVSIAFTFKNGTGSKKDFAGGCWTELFNNEAGIEGVLIHQTFNDMPCTYAVAAQTRESVELSTCLHFNPQGNGSEIWSDLYQHGQLTANNKTSMKTRKGQDIGAAICLKCHVLPGANQTLEFSLVWDMPVIHFRSREIKYNRRYTRWFGSKNEAAPAMSVYCLQHHSDWEAAINKWQNPVLSAKDIPKWYKALLFNELYYVSDGGTVWLDPVEQQESDQSPDHLHLKEYSKFAYLEGQEYRMYNTYDVHFYASFALIMLWPNLQLSLQYDIAKAIVSEDKEPVKFCMGGHMSVRKVANTVPHDIGDPEDEPWLRVNSYNIHPTEDWKDLNLKFVLQVYRDYHATQDRAYLEYMYPVMKVLMEKSLQWDKDNDGLIENGGFADQTFDAWIVHGASAYCGGMWLAALRMTVEAADILGKQEDKEDFERILNKGKESFEVKLWNGSYYNYDCSTQGIHDSIMADQLAGHWYLKASGLDDYTVFPEDHVRDALKVIFKYNVMGFADGNMGAINGTRPDGKKDITSCQSEEFWTGVTYGVAAQMIQENMLKEGFQTAWGNYNVNWEWLGLMFQSPEAYMDSKHFRSLGYMRPLAIWSMQWALDKFHSNMFASD